MRWVPVRLYSMGGFGHLFARQMSGFLSRPCFQPSRIARAALKSTIARVLPMALAGRPLNAQTAYCSGTTISLSSGFKNPAGVAVDGAGTYSSPMPATMR